MKKLLAILLVVIVATLAFCVPALASLRHVPHEDPADAESSIGVRSLLWYYGDALTMVAAREYIRADSLIQTLDYANILEEYRDIVDRYNHLSSDLLWNLNDLDMSLSEVSSLLDQYLLDEAAVKLDEARVLLDQAKIILTDIEDNATEDVGRLLGVFDTPADSLERQSYAQLHAAIDIVWELIAEYDMVLEEQGDEASTIKEKELKPTWVTLEVSPRAAFVGDLVTLHGLLASYNGPLKYRKISLLLDGEPVDTTTTGSDGSFRTTQLIPFKYVPTMTLQVQYTPYEDDRDKYLPSISPSREIDVMFYRTELDIEAPEEAYPGLPTVIRGKLAWEGDEVPGGRSVKVRLDGGLWATTTVQEQRLEVEGIPEPGISVGNHTLTVTVEPQARYAGISKETTLHIVKISPEVHIDAPSLTVIPSTVHVSGTVSSPFPLQQARVIVEMGGDWTEVETSDGGEFSASVSIGLDLVFVGPEDLVVKVEPVEPWHRPVEVEVRVFVVNLTNVGITLVVAVGLGVLLVTKRRGRAERGEAPSLEAPVVVERPAEAVPGLEPAVRFEGFKGRLLEAYLRAAVTVQKATGVPTQPHMTLREFLREATPGMQSVVEPFARLTRLAERALYSPHVPGTDDADEAERLALEVKEVLKGGVA